MFPARGNMAEPQIGVIRIVQLERNRENWFGIRCKVITEFSINGIVKPNVQAIFLRETKIRSYRLSRTPEALIFFKAMQGAHIRTEAESRPLCTGGAANK